MSGSLLVVGTILVFLGKDEGCKIYNLAARANFESEALEEPRIKVCNLATERKIEGVKYGLQDDNIRVGSSTYSNELDQ